MASELGSSVRAAVIRCRGGKSMTLRSTVAGFVTFTSVGILLTAAPARAQQPAAGQVTFARDVAPILQRSCQNCHRPGSVGPMSLMTYEDARPWARSIRNRVTKREMPPWTLDKNV